MPTARPPETTAKGFILPASRSARRRSISSVRNTRRLEPVLLTDPVVLENPFVRLEPLSPAHADDLADAREGLEYAWYTSVPAPNSVRPCQARALAPGIPG
jgi:hypothetical protein